MRSLWQSIWARALLSPTSRSIPCNKHEIRISGRCGLIQLWEERNGIGAGDPDLVVLRLLGARGRAELATADPANRLSGVSHVVCTLNPPTFGRSSGPLTIDNYLHSATSAFEDLKARYPNSCIWIYGKSIGACAAMHISANRNPDAVIFKNIIGIPQVVRNRIPVWMPTTVGRIIHKRIPPSLLVEQVASKAKASALFVISAADTLSPAHVQNEVIKAYGEPVASIIVAGGHDDASLRPEDESAYHDAINELWLRTRRPTKI